LSSYHFIVRERSENRNYDTYNDIEAIEEEEDLIQENDIAADSEGEGEDLMEGMEG
jgi:hypothetical protein